MKRFRFILLITGCLVSTFAVAAERLIEVESPRGVTQRAALIEVGNPRAMVLLFAGGKGALKLEKALFGGVHFGWGRKNFLVRTREQFARHGLMVVTVDAPSDQQERRGMFGGFRSSQAHVQDIDALIGQLREIADVPVWLVGTSRGTESVTNIAIGSQQNPHGLVLTSSMTEGDRKGQAVLDFDLSAIGIPTLITHHRNDGCRKTDPSMVDAIAAGLSKVARVEVKMFEGGREQSKPCKAMSYHGYLGIEDRVVDAIAAFILEHT